MPDPAGDAIDDRPDRRPSSPLHLANMPQFPKGKIPNPSSLVRLFRDSDTLIVYSPLEHFLLHGGHEEDLCRDKEPMCRDPAGTASREPQAAVVMSNGRD